MSLPLPVSAAIDVQTAFRDVDRRLLSLERTGRTAGGVSQIELDRIVRGLRDEIGATGRKANFLDFNDVFRASGPAHEIGYVPDPGSTVGSTRFLCENATWATPSMSAAGGWIDTGVSVELITPSDRVGIGISATARKLSVSQSLGPSVVGVLFLQDGTQFEEFHVNITAGSYNPLVLANDHAIIFSNGTVGTGSFLIAPWSSTGFGLRVTSTGLVGINCNPVNGLQLASATADATSARIQAQNTNAGSAVAPTLATIELKNDLNCSVYLSMFSSGSTGSVRWGVPLANYAELASFTSTNGLIIGTNPAAPLLFGTNNVERVRILSTGFVGVHTSTPSVPLEVSSVNAPGAAGTGCLIISGSVNKERLEIISVGAAPAPTVQALGGGGTVAAPTQTLAGTTMLQVGGSGYDNTNARIVGNLALIGFVAAENLTTAARGAYISLQTVATGTTTPRVEVMRVQDGNVGIGTTTYGAGKVTLALGNATTDPTVAISGVTHFSNSARARVFGVYGNMGMGGNLKKYDGTTPGNAAGGADTDLLSYTIKANSMAAVGDGVLVRSWFFLANNGNTKTLKWKVGAGATTSILTGVYTNVWAAVAIQLHRTGTNTESSYISVLVGSPTLSMVSVGHTEVTTSDIVIKFQGAGTAANDIQQVHMIVECVG